MNVIALAATEKLVAELSGFTVGVVRGSFSREISLALLRQQALAEYSRWVSEGQYLFQILDQVLETLESVQRIKITGDRRQPTLTIIKLLD